MFLLDNPYVSEFLRQNIETMERSVVDTPAARTFMNGSTASFIDETEFARRILAGERVYTNSENGLDVILRNAGQSDLARQIEICKDKALFRETVAALYPGYRFARVTPDDLDSFDVSDMPYPFVAKPARGFFSLGVHMVFEPSQWPEVVEKIRQERESLNAEYPEEVVNSGEFILEQGIDGEEYAIDVYYDDSGRAVITNILYHQFASEDDVSDPPLLHLPGDHRGQAGTVHRDGHPHRAGLLVQEFLHPYRGARNRFRRDHPHRGQPAPFRRLVRYRHDPPRMGFQPIRILLREHPSRLARHP